MKIDHNTLRVALVVCGAAPLLYFWHAYWVHAALLAYLLTAGLFGIVLLGEYPPFRTAWFWKTMVPIVVVHSAIVGGVVWLNLEVPGINKAPRALYGFASLILAIEWRLSVRLINALEPRRK